MDRVTTSHRIPSDDLVFGLPPIPFAKIAKTFWVFRSQLAVHLVNTPYIRLYLMALLSSVYLEFCLQSCQRPPGCSAVSWLCTLLTQDIVHLLALLSSVYLELRLQSCQRPPGCSAVSWLPSGSSEVSWLCTLLTLNIVHLPAILS